MKKIAKLSLVAAIAVAGMTNVNAASLEEAIKDVSISGKVQMRVNASDAGVQTNDNEIEITAKIPVNDQVTFVTKLDHVNKTSNTDSTDKQPLNIEDYYLSYNNAGVTLNVGQQNIPARFSYGKQGDGVVALTKVGGFTVGAAYFMNNSSTGNDNEDVSSVLAKGSIAGVALSAQVLDVQDTVQLSEITASTTVQGVNVAVSHNAGNYDTGADTELTVVKASGKIGPASVSLAYGKTAVGNNTARGALLGADGMNNAANFGVWVVSIDEKSDAELVVAKVSLPVISGVTFTAAYADGEYGASKELKETFGQISYKMSKNLSAYARISDNTVDTTDKTNSRVQVLYTF